jgi:hypothetical protein
MIGKRQFSLGYLISEVAVLALAMGFTRLLYVLTYKWPFSQISGFAAFGSTIAASVLWGAAIGGLFGKMTDGAMWGFLVFPLFAILTPAVMS